VITGVALASMRRSKMFSAANVRSMRVAIGRE
jgi:hypothetical protein